MPRKRKEFQVEVTVSWVPLPPEKRWAYEEAWRLIFELLAKANAPQTDDLRCATPNPVAQGERLSE